uniref:Chitin-binding type-2 domain-containing protein n=1 Tax=Anopheles stephensi TaxID=30069 RepID=A0A182YEH5_ANOST
MSFISLLLLLTGTGEVRGHVSEPSSAGNSNSIRTVMDLMEVMLNRNILDMLKNGGFDFREPARIFLPPKFYSVVPLDPGHMSPDQILTHEHTVPSSVAFGGKADQQQQQQQPLKPDGAVAEDSPRRAVGWSVSDEGGGSRINLISYSDGKVTTAGGLGGGRRPAVTNKGSETLEKNVATNGLVGTVVPAMVRTNFQERINGKEMTPANGERWQPSLTTSITDQTVSQNVGRTLPTSGRVGRLTGSGGSSTTDRLRSALPGEPDVDYPILGSVPTTQFSCDKRHHGYYADVEARCQVFRVCANTDSTGRGFAFLCPNGTLFNQRHLVCDWYMNVRCEESESLYHVNEAIGRMASDNPRDMMSVVMSMVTYPMRSLMDMMDGVGVIEERFEGGERERPQEQVKVSPSVGRSDGFVTPGAGLEPPPFAKVRYSGDLDDYSPEVTNYEAGVSPSVGPQMNRGTENTYRPMLDNVYVSSLGTLSTDRDSGFDPARSTLLSKPADGVAQSYGGPQTDSFGVSDVNQPKYTSPFATDIELVKADLVHSWNDQPTPLKLSPVSQTFPQQTPTSQHTPIQPPHQTTHSVPKQGSILPPTGVLPPSTSLTRTVLIGGNRKYTNPSASAAGHRFAPVRKVLPIQKVTVVPENSYQMQSNSYTRAQNFYPTSYPTPSVYRGDSVQPTSDVLSAIPASTNVSPRRYKTTTVLQVVPSLSFYLNDAQEKRAFDEAVRQGLFDERRRRAYTSYDVPLGSVGRLWRKA